MGIKVLPVLEVTLASEHLSLPREYMWLLTIICHRGWLVHVPSPSSRIYFCFLTSSVAEMILSRCKGMLEGSVIDCKQCAEKQMGTKGMARVPCGLAQNATIGCDILSASSVSG